MKELSFGESPFDEWDRERLMRFAQRCYAALQACSYPLHTMREDDIRRNPGHAFWNGDGTGARAVSLLDAITREVGYDDDGGSAASENLYRAFYRPYLPLLFPDARQGDGQSLFPPRYICDGCKVWIQPQSMHDAYTMRGQHGEKDCPGEWRRMTPEDLPPVKGLPLGSEQDAPRGYIQWKGTDVCFDLTCVCGTISHFDGLGMYLVRCPVCERVYEPPLFVSLRLVPPLDVDEEKVRVANTD